MPLPGWSMAKSVTGALAGVLVARGAWRLDAPVAVPEWRAPGTRVARSPLDQLLRMSSGLEFERALRRSALGRERHALGDRRHRCVRRGETARAPAGHALAVRHRDDQHPRARDARSPRRASTPRSRAARCSSRSGWRARCSSPTRRARSSAPRSCTRPRATGRASACSFSMTACGTASGSCRRAGRARRRYRRFPAAATARTGGCGSSGRRRGAGAAPGRRLPRRRACRPVRHRRPVARARDRAARPLGRGGSMGSGSVRCPYHRGDPAMSRIRRSPPPRPRPRGGEKMRLAPHVRLALDRRRRRDDRAEGGRVVAHRLGRPAVGRARVVREPRRGDRDARDADRRRAPAGRGVRVRLLEGRVLRERLRRHADPRRRGADRDGRGRAPARTRSRSSASASASRSRWSPRR